MEAKAAVKIAAEAFVTTLGTTVGSIKNYTQADATTTGKISEVIGTLNTQYTSGQFVSNSAVTVDELIKTAYQELGVTGDEQEKITNREKLQAAKDAKKDFDAALQSFKDATAALSKDIASITNSGNANQDKVNTDNIKAIAGLTDLINAAKIAQEAILNKSTIANATGTSINDLKGGEIDNKSTTNATVKTDGVDAVKLTTLLTGSNSTVDVDKYQAALKAFNDLYAALEKQGLTSAVSDAAKNSEVIRSLKEAGLNDLFIEKIQTASGEITEASLAKDIAEQIEKPINEASKSLSNVIGGGLNAPATALSMANQTNTMTRLAKLSSPYSKDLALASAIKNMEGLELASGDNSALSSIIKEYTKRFDYDNSLWANVIGAKGYTDNGDPKLYGFSVGYDRSFDNFLLGSYFTYAKSDLDTSYLESEADNFELGIYSRAYLGDSELDTTLSFGIGKNDINNYKLVNEYLNGDYDSKFINIAATYGYVVKAQNNFFIKPFIGLNYAYNKNDSFTLSNATIQGYEVGKIDGSTLSANLGVEFRQYLSDGSFMFVAPSVEQELSVSRDDLVSKFRGASTSFTTKADESKDTYAKVIAGGEYAVTRDFSATISAGFKTNGDDKYVNGSLGVKYKF
ncbi:autotransporter outer membrane beta-barrel domain-containing protein [Campylobacter hyointestinalis]|uniref:autotransporter outer membrane beta-barrel domain-containing protein n=1 Tax=Campylobacter hyointestinalis TaxID=198 RepID=UPI0025542DD2|nr:autotransporter outer membrane beta-barrel domain-containing protein [Campylobacter hyointestinalis]MDL2350508.1 autotransporter outer membrane beta-barrel domain-containing protein [Campylobacter hyointestinalis]MDM1025943.1 autotransporter outer membrane beta-barrel domain-containing protein [Campylobacter hyointestinalis]